MKKLNLLIVLGIFCMLGQAMGQEIALKNTDTKLSNSSSQISWEEKLIDVGKIELNKPVEVNYRFTNTGETPAIIKNLRTSCGCTAAQHSQEPVLPGESSTIKVKYNAKSSRAFKKSITITTSVDPKPVVLRLSGEVR